MSTDFTDYEKIKERHTEQAAKGTGHASRMMTVPAKSERPDTSTLSMERLSCPNR
jgi:hypothetical protein